MKDHVQKPAKEARARPLPDRLIGRRAAHPILRLQRTIGNRAVTAMIQRHSAGEMAR
jgi:hypothetical protein